MRVLVACEFSGRVRDAFLANGHDAWSCDIFPTESTPERHIVADVREVLVHHWDLLIAFPPCTYLAGSGARWWKNKQKQQLAAIEFVKFLWNSKTRVCIENPVGILSNAWRKPTQIIQPWQFGHPESKRTCLWLKGLPKLVPTDNIWRPGPWNNQGGYLGSTSQTSYGGKDRQRVRSLTYSGIAKAMADQWGGNP